MIRSVSILLMALSLCQMSLRGAEASECQKDMRRLKDGTLVPSSSCENAYLAKVASEYGIKVSGAALGNNPNLKKDVCRSIFNDIRVFLICETVGIPERI